MKLEEIPTCPDCAQQHLGRCGGASFRQRLFSVSPTRSVIATRSSNYYNEDAVTSQFKGLTTKERRQDYWDSTNGYGASYTDKQGRIWNQDRKTKDWRQLTPSQVEDAYMRDVT